MAITEFDMTLKISKKGESLGTWIVDPDDYHTITAISLVELLSKLLLLVPQIQQKLHDDELLELRMQNDDIPF